MIEFTRIRHDVNGNPRYVCHFLNLLTEQEQKSPMWDESGRRIHPTGYEIAVKRANKIGGRKYNNKSYAGGIVFQSYSLRETEKDILNIVAQA